MLVLTRSSNERIVIKNYDIVITVLSIKGSQVRLGLEAPREVKIFREEVFSRIQSQRGDQ